MALLDDISNEWSSVISGLVNKTAKNTIWSVIQRLTFGATIYFLWQERNIRRIEQKVRSVDVLFNVVVESVGLKFIGLTLRGLSGDMAYKFVITGIHLIGLLGLSKFVIVRLCTIDNCLTHEVSINDNNGVDEGIIIIAKLSHPCLVICLRWLSIKGVWMNSVFDCLLCTTVENLSYDQLARGSKSEVEVRITMGQFHLLWLVYVVGSHDGTWLDCLLCTTVANMDCDQPSYDSNCEVDVLTTKGQLFHLFWPLNCAGLLSRVFGFGVMDVGGAVQKVIDSTMYFIIFVLTNNGSEDQKHGLCSTIAPLYWGVKHATLALPGFGSCEKGVWDAIATYENLRLD
ncbi:hypothetical protein Tco_1368459 [Tanacetum coccineum]